MTSVRVLNAEAVRDHTNPAPLREALRQGLMAIAEETVSAPARISAHSPRGLVGAMPGFVPGVGMAAKLVTVFPDNHSAGLPSHQGVVAVFDPETGSLQGLLDAATVTSIRTAQNAAVAADVLARTDARSLCILGAGVQGHEHLLAFADLRPWTSVVISSRNFEHARSLAQRFPQCEVVESFDEAVGQADVVCCCTDSQSPLFAAESVRPGTHVSSVGRGEEIPANLLPPHRKTRVFVEWPGAVLFGPPAGTIELQHLRDGEGVADSVTLLGDVLLERRAGRLSDQEITVFKSTGHATQDLALAVVALNNAGDAVPRIEM